MRTNTAPAARLMRSCSCFTPSAPSSLLPTVSNLQPPTATATATHLKGVRVRMTPNTSVLCTTCTLPASSGRSSSSTVPRAATISCTLGAEKLP
jgi:hypothetical protein